VICLRTVPKGKGLLLRNYPVHERCDTMVRMAKGFNEDDPRTWGPAFGEDPDPPVKGLSTKRGNPAAALAYYFDDQWTTVALGARPEWVGAVEAGPLGPMIGYATRKMAHVELDHAKAMVDEFVHRAVEDLVDFREGQNAWQRFTSWWGTAGVEDPAIAAAAQAESARKWEAYRRQTEG
jgi:hypothetical protein